MASLTLTLLSGKEITVADATLEQFLEMRGPFAHALESNTGRWFMSPDRKAVRDAVVMLEERPPSEPLFARA